jgi:hypothetical protein
MSRVVRALFVFALIQTAATPALAQTDTMSNVVARVTAVQGAVLVVRGEARLDAAEGLSLERQDELLTPRNGRIRLSFRDGTVVAVGPSSRVLIVHYLDTLGMDDAEAPLLELVVGILRATVPSIGSLGFSVETRAAVASSRSTDWIIEAGEEKTAVVALGGVVEVEAATGDSMLLTGGEGVDVALGAPMPAEPSRWPSDRVIDFVTRTTVE